MRLQDRSPRTPVTRNDWASGQTRDIELSIRPWIKALSNGGFVVTWGDDSEAPEMPVFRP